MYRIKPSFKSVTEIKMEFSFSFQTLLMRIDTPHTGNVRVVVSSVDSRIRI